MLLGSSDAIHLGQQTLSAMSTLHPVAAGSVSGWGRHLATGLTVLGLSGLAESARRLSNRSHQLAEEDRLRREVTAYLTLDLSPRCLLPQDFGRLVCRTVATRSSFSRAALLLPNDAGQLAVAGSAGVDDLTVQALNRWGAEASADPAALQSRDRAGANSFRLVLERRARQPETHTLNCSTMVLIPMRTATGFLGALTVCATLRPSVRGKLSPDRLHRLLEPLEALALNLTLQLSQIPRTEARRNRPQPSRPGAERAATAQRAGRRRRRADHNGAPVLDSPSHISLQQLVAIASAATSLPAARPAGVMVGFPAIDYDRALPALMQLSGRTSDPGATLAVVPPPRPRPQAVPPPEPLALLPPNPVALAR